MTHVAQVVGRTVSHSADLRRPASRSGASAVPPRFEAWPSHPARDGRMVGIGHAGLFPAYWDPDEPEDSPEPREMVKVVPELAGDC
jgi:hypothetical protein